MKTRLVKSLMVPLSEYATVSHLATLYDAIAALEKSQQLDQSHYKHRAVLVFDDENRVIGKLGLFDILTALEDKYARIGDLAGLSGHGFTSAFVRSILSDYSFWSEPLADICQHTTEIEVGSIMHVLTEGEYIDEDATLDLAVHQLIMGHHQSLIVTRGDEIIGILKLSDVFREISKCVLEQTPSI